MTEIVPTRVTGRIDGDFVVFLIGMRINKPWKLHKGCQLRARCQKCLRRLKLLRQKSASSAIPGWVELSCNIGAASITWSATQGIAMRYIGRPGLTSIAA